MPIFMEIAKDGKKNPNPFKFNSNWLGEDDYVAIIKEL